MEERVSLNNEEINNVLTEENNEIKQQQYQQQLHEKDLNDRYSYCEENKQEHIEINTLNSNDTIERGKEMKVDNNDEGEGEEEGEEQIDNNLYDVQENIVYTNNSHNKAKQVHNNNNNNINIEDNNDNDISIHNTNDNQQQLLNSVHNNYQISDSTANNNITTNNEQFNYQNTQHNLIPFNTLYYCQVCQNEFDTQTHLPLLFKCNHFFCKNCIEVHFLSSDGIKCPNDGYIASSLSECEVLTNIIPAKSSSSAAQLTNHYNTCQYHRSQPLTHYVEETREIICVYCAFNKMRSNSKLTIKEINEKAKEYLNDIEQLYINHNQYVNFLQELLTQITEHKQIQEQKVCGLFDQMISYLVGKKKMILNKINSLYSSNSKVIKDKIGLLERKEEIAEKLKNEFDKVEINAQCFNEVVDKFNEFLRDGNEKEQFDLEINEYNFAHDDENKAYKYINNFGDLKSKKRFFKFGTQQLHNENDNNNANMLIESNDNHTHTHGNKKSFLNFGDFARTAANINAINNNINTEIYYEQKPHQQFSSYKKQTFSNIPFNNINNTSRNNNHCNNDRFASLTKYTIPQYNNTHSNNYQMNINNTTYQLHNSNQDN